MVERVKKETGKESLENRLFNLYEKYDSFLNNSENILEEKDKSYLESIINLAKERTKKEIKNKYKEIKIIGEGKDYISISQRGKKELVERIPVEITQEDIFKFIEKRDEEINSILDKLSELAFIGETGKKIDKKTEKEYEKFKTKFLENKIKNINKINTLVREKIFEQVLGRKSGLLTPEKKEEVKKIIGKLREEVKSVLRWKELNIEEIKKDLTAKFKEGTIEDFKSELDTILKQIEKRKGHEDANKFLVDFYESSKNYFKEDFKKDIENLDKAQRDKFIEEQKNKIFYVLSKKLEGPDFERLLKETGVKEVEKSDIAVEVVDENLEIIRKKEMKEIEELIDKLQTKEEKLEKKTSPTLTDKKIIDNIIANLETKETTITHQEEELPPLPEELTHKKLTSKGPGEGPKNGKAGAGGWPPEGPHGPHGPEGPEDLLKQFKEDTTEKYLNQLSRILESLSQEKRREFLKAHYEKLKEYFGKDLVNDIVKIENEYNEKIRNNKEKAKELEAEKRKRIDDFVKQQRGKINTVLGILKKLEFDKQKEGKSEEELKKIREKIYKDYFKEVDNILDLINEAGKEADRRLGKRSKIREVLEKISAYRERHPVRFYLILAGLSALGIAAGTAIPSFIGGLALTGNLNAALASAGSAFWTASLGLKLPAVRFLTGIGSFLVGKGVKDAYVESKSKERREEIYKQFENYENLKNLVDFNKQLDLILENRIKDIKKGRSWGAWATFGTAFLSNLTISIANLYNRGVITEILNKISKGETPVQSKAPSTENLVITQKGGGVEHIPTSVKTPKPTFETLTIGKRGIEGAYIDHYMKLKDNKDAISNLVKSDLDFAKKFFGIKEDNPDKIAEIISK
jgi:hypothetical protein